MTQSSNAAITPTASAMPSPPHSPNSEVRFDGTVINAMTGMGTASDKTSHTTVASGIRLSKQQQEELYRNWLCRNICNAYPNEATREWAEITLGSEGDAELISAFDEYANFGDEDEALGVAEAFKTAQTWANIYGGAAIVIYAEDGQPPFMPLRRDRLRSIQKLEVLDRHKIVPAISINNWNPQKPEYYEILLPNGKTDIGNVISRNSPKGIQFSYRIHSSRIIRFDGVVFTPDMLMENSGWGGSLLESIWETHKTHDTGYSAVANVLTDFSLFVWKLKGLTALASTGQEEALRNRFRAMRMGASVFGGMAIDADAEALDFVSRQFGGIPEVLEKFREQLIGASGLPHTVLFGESPSGLGASGQSEERTWAKMVGQFQKTVFYPKLRRLYRLIWLAKDGPSSGKEPKGWGIKFRPLLEQSEEEKANAKSTQSNTDRTYIDSGVVLPEEIRASRFGGSEYSYETVLDEKLWLKRQKEQEFDSFGDFGAEEAAPPIEAAEEIPSFAPSQIDNLLPAAIKGDSKSVSDLTLNAQPLALRLDDAFQIAREEALAKFKILPNAIADEWIKKRVQQLRNEK